MKASHDPICESLAAGAGERKRVLENRSDVFLDFASEPRSGAMQAGFHGLREIPKSSAVSSTLMPSISRATRIARNVSGSLSIAASSNKRISF